MSHSMRSGGILDEECGQSNALVRLGNRLNRDNIMAQQTLPFGAWGKNQLHQQLASEYLRSLNAASALSNGGVGGGGPQVFAMQNLLNQVKNLEDHQQLRTNENLASSWASEFGDYVKSCHQHQQAVAATIDSTWIREYLKNGGVGDPRIALPLPLEKAWAGALHDYRIENAAKWSSEYLDEAERQMQQQQSWLAAMAAANKQQQQIPLEESALWESQYLKYIDKDLQENQQKNLQAAWAEAGGGGSPDTELSSAAAARAAEAVDEEQQQNFWSRLESQWDAVAGEHPWLDEYQSFAQQYKNYEFAETNQFLAVDNPLAEGRQRLAEGSLAAAVLLFESAVQREQENPEAWLMLGIAQAENEQEPQAIAALQRCVSLDQSNAIAHLQLAVSFCNESLQAQACRSLSQWLQLAHPLPEATANQNESSRQINRSSSSSSFLDHSAFVEVEQAILAAVQRGLGEVIQPDLQNALGILYNMSSDYEKAVQCLQLALHMQPNDARLWNRLGATLANSGRSAEAVSAYARALQLYPAFVRARYNLGIACMNLHAYREATEHLVTALALQRLGLGPQQKLLSSASSSSSSAGYHPHHLIGGFSSVWNTVRMCVTQLGDPEAMEMVDRRDVDGLSAKFNVNVVSGGGSGSSQALEGSNHQEAAAQKSGNEIGGSAWLPKVLKEEERAISS